jgi:ketosteroid isomerase-like protein
MSMTREQMDELVNQHFMFEATDDVEGVLATLAEQAEHEVIPSPMGALTDHDQMRSYYQMLFGDLKGESVTPLRRLYGEDFLIDETLWHGRIKDGRPFLCDGKNGKVSFRLLHLFQLREGKISHEQVWCDLAAIQQQLGCTPS